MPETREESLLRFAEEDKLFAARQASGEWPQKKCGVCHEIYVHPDNVFCCQRAHHFTGGLCLHCGFDERRVAVSAR
jgi:hypothetical protein